MKAVKQKTALSILHYSLYGGVNMDRIDRLLSMIRNACVLAIDTLLHFALSHRHRTIKQITSPNNCFSHYSVYGGETENPT